MADIHAIVVKTLRDQPGWDTLRPEIMDTAAEAVIDALVDARIVSVYRQAGRCGLCGCDSCEPPKEQRVRD